MDFEKNKEQDHFVVAIGASAGGLEALKQFFDSAEDNHELSYIIVQHLSSRHKSALVELLSRHTRMEVSEARHGSLIKAGHVYVIPPAKRLTVQNRKLHLTEKDPENKLPSTDVDTFLNSFAEEFEERAIAVILSGAGTDGSRGIEAIKDYGGLVIAQEPSTAEFSGMPSSSVATGKVDLILPVKKIHKEILQYVEIFPSKENESSRINEKVIPEILRTVLEKTGCDFQHYKLPTVLRRINRRLAFLKLDNAEEYLKHIRSQPDECHHLSKDLLIGVTRFFRDKEAFRALRENTLVPLVESKKDNEVIKVWVAACSTGEEAYSIAILLQELIEESRKNIEVKIFATDLDQTHIDKASRGTYGRFITKEIPADLLGKYFTERENSFSISPLIRKQIVFAKHNVAFDVPFIRNDLISCRNMLIYVNNDLQKKIFYKFYFGLADNGHLFLGSSENVSLPENFPEVDRKWRIFRKGPKPQRPVTAVPDKNRLNILPPVRDQSGAAVSKVQSDVNTQVLFDLNIAIYYIDRQNNIRDTAGSYKKYIELPEEGLRFNLMRMLPDGLSIPVSSAIQKAWRSNSAITLDQLFCKIGDENLSLTINLRRVPPNEDLLMIAINSAPLPHFYGDRKTPDNDLTDEAAAEITFLREQLSKSREDLQNAVEQLETANEELQSSNEELTSSNEELQNSNEELQSLNEELHTLNAEHQLKINELVELNDDLNNYFRSSEIGQIIVDASLKLRKFNPAAEQLVRLISSDVGRPISHLKTNFRYAELEEDILGVIRSQQLSEKEVPTFGGRTLLIRIFPYLKKNKQTDGAVISFVDITTYKELHSIISGVFEASNNSILAVSAVRDKKSGIEDIVLVTANTAARKLLGEIISEKNVSLEKVHAGLADSIYHHLVEVIEKDETYHQELSLDNQWLEITAVKMMDGAVLTITDISDRKKAETKIRQSYSELYATKEKLRVLNSDLEAIVAQRTHQLAASEERFRLVSTVTTDAIIDWNFVDNTLWVSDNFYRLFGYDKRTTRVTREFWLSRIMESDRQEITRSINDCINNGQTIWTKEYRFMDSSGQYRIIYDRGHFVLDENGTPYRMLSSMLDITELRKTARDLKESELRVQLALDEAQMATWDLEFKTDELKYSRKLPEIFGRQNSVILTSELFRSQFHPEDAEMIEKIYNRAFDGASYNYEARIIWPDGSVHWIKTVGSVLFNENDEPERFIGITRETTREKNAKLELEEKVKERTLALSKSNSDLEQFAYIASHDLQEPLRKIQTFISLVREKKGKHNSEVYLEKISSSAARMASLIRNVLEFSKLSKKSEGITRVDLNDVMKQLLVDFELILSEKEGVIQCGRLPVVSGIRYQISQLFFNLISNSLKFTQTAPRIEIVEEPVSEADLVRCPELERKRAYVKIRISDNGIGFDQKFAEKVFSFFYRLDADKQYPGNGIGLALCKKIVQNHQGAIWVNSLIGQGSDFFIILPSD